MLDQIEIESIAGETESLRATFVVEFIQAVEDRQCVCMNLSIYNMIELFKTVRAG